MTDCFGRSGARFEPKFLTSAPLLPPLSCRHCKSLLPPPSSPLSHFHFHPSATSWSTASTDVSRELGSRESLIAPPRSKVEGPAGSAENRSGQPDTPITRPLLRTTKPSVLRPRPPSVSPLFAPTHLCSVYLHHLCRAHAPSRNFHVLARPANRHILDSEGIRPPQTS